MENEADGREVEDLVAEYIDRLNRGERLTADQIRETHPELAEKLLDHLQAFLDLEDEHQPLEFLGTLGDYTLRRQIGRGGMGVVYEAWENSMDRRVALKVLPPGVAADERALQRFVREAKTAGQLSHPNVVSVYGMGLKEQTPYYAMELVDGETLAQVLLKLKQADPEAQTLFGLKDQGDYFVKIARSFADVADGLQHAHSKGIIHRDIKPSNLILDLEGRLRILDFGLAKNEGQESLSATGDVVGTPLYMSPEQARRKKIPIDHRTDNYSLGATMYEMLTLQPPFQGKDHQDTLSQIIERDPVEPRKLNQRVPKDLETIVLKCLRKEPDDRYGTAEALGQDLRRFVRGDAIEARPQAGWERLVRRAWHQKVRVLAWTCFLLLLFAAGLLIRGRQREIHEQGEAQYRKSVLDAVMKLQLGHMNRKSARETGRFEMVTQASLLDGAGLERLHPKEETNPIEEAVEELRKAAARFPDRPDAHLHRARGLLDLERTDEALQEVEAILRSDARFVPAQVLRAALLHQADPEVDRVNAEATGKAGDDARWRNAWLQAFQSTAASRWQQAAAAFQTLLEAGSTVKEPYIGAFLEARLGRGLAHLEMRDFDQAIEDFVIVESQFPESIEPGFLKAKAYYMEGKKDRAGAVFKSLFEHARIPDEAALWIAGAYLFFDDYEPGLSWAEKVKEEYYRELTRMCFLCKLSRFEEAIKAGTGLLKTQPNDSRVHCDLSWALNSLGRWKEAADEARRSLELDPRGNYSHLMLGWALLNLGEPKEALQTFQMGMDLHPKDPILPFDAGWHFRDLGMLDDAVTMFQRATELDPDFMWAHDNLGRTYGLQNKVEDAIATLQKAIAINPSPPYLHESLGQALAQKGMNGDAVVAFREALRLDPRSTRTRLQLASLLERMNDLDQAREEYREALKLDPSLEEARKKISILEREH